jgi:hypothetical protein
VNRLLKELRRREVFRSAGLYVGVSWILIEGASVVCAYPDKEPLKNKKPTAAAAVRDRNDLGNTLI